MSVATLATVAGSVIATVALIWTIYWNKSEHDAKPQFFVTTGDCVDSDPFLQRVPYRMWVRVANTGKSTLLLDGVALTGAATADDPFRHAVNAEKSRKENQAFLKQIGRAPPLAAISSDKAIEVPAQDSYVATLPLFTFKLLEIPGTYWGVEVISRTGEVWRIPAARVAMGERGLPRFLLDNRLIPDALKLKSWYNREMKLTLARIRRQAQTELYNEWKAKASKAG